MSSRDPIIVEIILPDTSWSRAKYKLVDGLYFQGVTVPAGFITDGATVPRFMWWLFPPISKYFIATVVHDYLLTTSPTNRKPADEIFRRGLKELGVVSWKANIMYYAVRVYGIIKQTIS